MNGPYRVGNDDSREVYWRDASMFTCADSHEAGELVEYLNSAHVKMGKLKAVADAAWTYRSYEERAEQGHINESDLRDSKSALHEALDALKPKPKEQLLIELLEAGDDLCNADGREHNDMVEKYRAAERAYEAAE